jgi:hypothetical protein
MAVNYEVVTEVREVEEVPEKMPESPWHSANVDELKGKLATHLMSQPQAVIIRDIYFQHKGKRYAPDLAVILQGTPPLTSIGIIYHVPEDGPPPDAVVEVAVNAKALGEAISEKADFYAELQVKEYLVVEAFPEKPVRLWFGRPVLGERPTLVMEARLETLGIIVRAEGQTVRLFDLEGNEILSPSEALERERAKRKELERKVAELERLLAQQQASA